MDSRAKQAARPKVFSIDSSSANQRVIAEALGNEYDLKAANSKLLNLETLYDFAPNIILLDIDLPNFDSLKVCRMIRQEARFARTPILFLSHMNIESEQFKGFAAGGDDFVTKPIVAQQLLAKLTLSLERARKQLNHASGQAYPSLELNTRTLLDYLIELIGLGDNHRLGDLMLTTLDRFGLKGAIYWHDDGETDSSIGPLTDLENVLLQQATQSFPLDHSARYIWGSTHFGAIIHNMPSPRSDHYQSMRQVVTALFQAAATKLNRGARGLAVPASSGLARGDLDREALSLHSAKLKASISRLENESESHLRRMSHSLQNLANDESRTEPERQQFQKLLNRCIQTRIAIYDQCLAMHTEHREILACLGHTDVELEESTF